MAEDKDTGQDDVQGHEMDQNARSEPPRKPGEAAARPDEDDVEGHVFDKNPEQGKKGAPGEQA